MGDVRHGPTLMGLRGFRLLFAIALVGVILVNTAVFPKIEQLTQTQRSKALSVASTGDFFDLAFKSGHSRSRFDLYYTFGELAPGSTVVIAGTATERRLVHTPFLYSAGKAASVQVVPESPLAAATDFDPTGFVVAEGPGGSGGPPWKIAMDSDVPSGSAPREFVLVDVPTDSSADYSATLLLVETSLVGAS